jgi:hypothetical protein
MFWKLTFVCLIFLSIFSVSAREITDREKSGLFGYVKSIREETAEILIKNGKPVEKKRILNSVETFDVSGKQLTHFLYDSDGKDLISGETFIYDASGRLIEKEIEHTEFLHLCDKKTYLYNQSGQPVEEQCFIENGKLVGKRLFRYDPNGLLFEEESISLIEKPIYFNDYLTRRKFDELGREIEIATLKKVNDEWQPEDFRMRFYKWIFVYDSRGHISKRIQIKPDETIFLISESSNDDKGNEIETIYCNAEGMINDVGRYEYEYDKQGNYVKEISYEWINENGKTYFQPEEKTYRKIEYFSKREIEQFEAQNAK